MMFLKRLRIFLLGMLLALSALPVVAQQGDPQQVVKDTAEAVLAEVTARKAELEADSSLIYPLVQRTVVHHFDFVVRTRSAMGSFLSVENDVQQGRIVAEFI